MTDRYEHPEPSEREMQGWLQRIDESVDVIAFQLGLDDIPYYSKPDTATWRPRYIAPYRLEMLETAIREAGYDAGSVHSVTATDVGIR